MKSDEGREGQKEGIYHFSRLILYYSSKKAYLCHRNEDRKY